MKNKYGVSLIVLVITIIVLLILASVTLVQITDSSSSARVANFANNISTIQEYIDSKIILNEKIPLVNENPFTITELVNNGYLMNSKSDRLKNEIIENGEDENTTFYIIDISKINDSNISIGNGKKGTDDYFAFSSNTNKVYYLYGINSGKKRYFSLNNEIMDISQTQNIASSTSTTTLESYSGVKINKSYTGYTNKMGINIQANLGSNENIFVTLGSLEDKKQFIKSSNTLNISFDDINELNSLLTSTFDTSIISSLENRYLIITKEDNGNVVSSYKIDLSNYDIDAPTISNLGSVEYTSMKMLTGDAADLSGKINSGVNNIRYDYLTNVSGDSYYNNGVNMNMDYMLNTSKIAKCDENGKFSIKVPDDVAKVRIICVDNAGNSSDMLDFSI